MTQVRSLALILSATVATCILPCFSADALKIVKNDSNIVVTDGNRLVMEYVYGKELSRPYVKQLCTPSGVNFLRDNVADHIHHHGLMFAVKVDGVDFWAEQKGCGRQVNGKIETGISRDDEGKNSVSQVLNVLTWNAPGQEKPRTEEARLVAIHDDSRSGQPLGATLLTWWSVVRPIELKAEIKLSGSHYFGLGMRFVKSMDGAEFFTAKGPVDGNIVRNDERLTPGNWCACYGQVDGKPVTVAMFDSPRNPRPVLWFTMAKQFSYLSATINLWKEPLTVIASKPLDLKYGVAAWDGKVSPEEIEKMFQRWKELGKDYAKEAKPAQ